jgi:hypothetical protein
MLARGEKPTATIIRAELGSGSLGTIRRHFTAWREKNRTGAVESVTLPVELQRAMLGHIERAAAEVRADLQAELAETQAEREALTGGAGTSNSRSCGASWMSSATPAAWPRSRRRSYAGNTGKSNGCPRSERVRLP